VIEPSSGRDVVSLGYVHSVGVGEGVVHVTFQLPAGVSNEPLQRQLREQTRAKVQRVPGVNQVETDFNVLTEPSGGVLAGVKHVVAVGAGKGGVGKSTLSLLLAYGLKRKGLKTGLLDADVYGPSMPKLTGTESDAPHADSQGRLIPPSRDGVQIMSMGYLVPPDQAVVWRGPMAQKYVKEFIDRGYWGELDYLIVDLPPGTGDIPLTLAQSIPLTGAVIVCTPQDVALLDAIKALRMYEKLGVPPLGFVENMSYYCCPQCGHRDELFGHGGCAAAAERLNVPFLGEIPLNIDLRKLGDEGNPDANFTRPEGYVVQAIEKVVDRLVEEIENRTKKRTPLPQLRVR
jgi:ATP-binding protein involved in chromosome partitioning